MAVAPALTPVSGQVPMVDLRGALAAADDAIQRNLSQLHQRGQYILGPQTAAFEEAFACAVGAASSLGVASGTAALELCLRSAGVGGGGCDVTIRWR